MEVELSNPQNPKAFAAVIPSTESVLALIGKRGVVVGSFPRKGLLAKDIDVVVHHNPEQRNQVFRDIQNQGWKFDSGITGHMVVEADPLNVEIFEGPMPMADPQKEQNLLTFYQARRKSSRSNCFGVTMWMLR